MERGGGGGGGEQETRSPREERLKNSHITVITKPKGRSMWGRVFSKGDMGSDPHSRKFTSGQPGMDWEAR